MRMKLYQKVFLIIGWMLALGFMGTLAFGALRAVFLSGSPLGKFFCILLVGLVGSWVWYSAIPQIKHDWDKVRSPQS